MRVLIACEFSGIVREEFRKRGHDAWSCDLLETEIAGQHIVGDIEPVLKEQWDLIIAHPPCTRLANSGVRWLREKDLWGEMQRAAYFFRQFLELEHVQRVCVENPVPHGYALSIIGKKYDQTIQPYNFGENASKRTCLWLKGLPLLKPTLFCPPNDNGTWGNQTPSGQNNLGPSADRWKERSRTYQGIAEAMAEQWG